MSIETEFIEELRQAEPRIGAILCASRAAIYIRGVDPDADWMYISPEIEKIVGFDRDQWIASRAWASQLHVDDRERVLDEKQRSVGTAGRGATTTEYRLRHKDGRTVWVRDSSEVVRAPDGTPLLFRGILVDVSERTRALEELREKEGRLRSLIEASAEWIWEMDADGRITYSNPACRPLLGYEADALTGSRVWCLIHHEDVQSLQLVTQRADPNDDGPKPSRMRWRHQDGSYRWLESYVMPIVAAGGSISGYRAKSRDVTERKRNLNLLVHQAKVLEMIARRAPLRETLDAITAGMEQESDDGLCSILLVDEKGEHLIPASSAALPRAYHDALGRVPIGAAAGACGSAASTGARVVTVDIASDPRWADYRHLTDAFGLRACWSDRSGHPKAARS